ncbi:GNAT family N-acetyltransferase [Halovulum dunhuangense]|uniref:GNAT family N-acetyltransferase n=1 Tax=Halovulum dunhuangense TaxID=1505036 RepID=A0A849L599_9RHOB|nr:GNAT family N-acetyltransferase [Halovulum dunhuangense]
MSPGVRRGRPDEPGAAALIAAHHAHAHAHTPTDSVFALDAGGLSAPEVDFFVIEDGGHILGMGALRRIGGREAEVKSMHVTETARGRGLARVMLRHLVAEARAMGIARLWLETGSMAAYAPARALYASEGFVPCARFGDYPEDPNSAYMTRTLS